MQGAVCLIMLASINGIWGGTTHLASRLSRYALRFFAFHGGPYIAATHASGSYLGPPALYPGETTPAKISARW